MKEEGLYKQFRLWKKSREKTRRGPLKTGILVILLLCNKLSHNTHLLSQNCIGQRVLCDVVRVLCSASQAYNQGANWTEFSSGSSGVNLLLRSFFLLAEFSSLWLYEWGPYFPAVRQPGPGLAPEAAYIPWYVASCIFNAAIACQILLVLLIFNFVFRDQLEKALCCKGLM